MYCSIIHGQYKFDIIFFVSEVINKPGVAGAVLQTPLSFTD